MSIPLMLGGTCALRCCTAAPDVLFKAVVMPLLPVYEHTMLKLLSFVHNPVKLLTMAVSVAVLRV